MGAHLERNRTKMAQAWRSMGVLCFWGRNRGEEIGVRRKSGGAAGRLGGLAMVAESRLGRLL